ncbi:MAG TPA: FAD-binding protein [Marmoricola sp.]|nr:FAD-binding protein [Marmoricola sp.]
MSPQSNWAGNHVYQAERIVTPSSVDELREVVAIHRRVRPIGSRHSFTALPDTHGVLVATSGLPVEVEIDSGHRTVIVSGGASYGRVARELHRQGWALANLASLPHISVAGAVATGTHGSGDGNQCLAAAVRSLEVVGADGELRRMGRGEADLDGSVVALGCLGVVVRLELDIEPTFELRQDVYVDLPWDVFLEDPAAVTGAGYSVSLFTDWAGDRVDQVWLKSRVDAAPPEVLGGARRAGTPLHMLRGGLVDAVTEQQGVPGPWHERLPHFRLEFTPSHGEELQSEYLLPRARLASAVDGLRRLAPRLAPVLQVSEIRTVAADRLWLSGAYGEDTVGLHFTWRRDPERVEELLPVIEELLLPLGARPHWGKCFVASGADLAAAFARLPDFLALRERHDPEQKFFNAFLGRAFGVEVRA